MHYRQGRQSSGLGGTISPTRSITPLHSPGFFRGALDVQATRISDEMKVAAAHALADYVKKARRDRILPAIFNLGVVAAVARAVSEAAAASGVPAASGDP
jgi:malate dehydrogenase (oxaloacetate-decarboxylating)